MSEDHTAPDAPGPGHPDEGPAPADAASAPDDDAWATAAEEDLEAERTRRRAQYGPPPGSAAEELRKLVDAVTDKLSGLGASPLLEAVAGPAAQQAVRQAVRQAKAVVEPVVERNPDVFEHLAAAGGELLAAYRSAVQAQERRWTAGDSGRAGTPGRDEAAEDRRDDDGPGAGPAHHIDLD